MDVREREYHVARIMSGIQLIKLSGRTFVLGRPTARNKYFAQEVFQETYESALRQDVFTDETILEFLKNKGLWNNTLQIQLDGMHELIEDKLVELYDNMLSDNSRELRLQLKDLRDRENNLYSIRHSYDHLTCEYLATIAKYKFITGASLEYLNGASYWKVPYLSWNKPDRFLEAVVTYCNHQSILPSSYRELAKTDPWNKLWGMRRTIGKNIFGCSLNNMSDSQIYLLFWSSMYDCVYKHSERPIDEIIQDDDLLDGWFIKQKRIREKEENKQYIEGKLKNPKIANAHEIFIVANSEDGAKKVIDMNDNYNERLRNQRMRQLKEQHYVKEIDMVDMRQELIMKENAASFKGR